MGYKLKDEEMCMFHRQDRTGTFACSKNLRWEVQDLEKVVLPYRQKCFFLASRGTRHKRIYRRPDSKKSVLSQHKKLFPVL